jgi:hypothetical protein
MSDNSLLIEIKGSAKEFVEALELVKKKGSDLESQFKVMGLISGAAFASATAEIGLSTAAYGKQEIAVNRLSQTMQAQGIFSEELKQSYVETAEAIEKKTGVDAEAILAGQGLLQTMVGQIPITRELTQGVVDLAARTGKDLNSAFEEVGKGINGHAKELKNMGIEVDASATREERLAQISRQLAAGFDGAAESAASGLGGYRLLSAAYEELQKKIGVAFAPALTEAITLMRLFLNTIAEHKELTDLIISMTAAVAIVGAIGTAVAGGALAFFKLREALEVAKVGMSAMQIATTGLIGATGIGLLVIVASEIYLHWSTIWPALQAGFRAFADNTSEVASGMGRVLRGALHFDLEEVKAGFEQVKAAMRQGVADFKKIQMEGDKAQEDEHAAHEERQNATTKAAADKREAERRDLEARQLAHVKAQNDLIQLESERASKAAIDLKKQEVEITGKLADEKYKRERVALERHLADMRFLEESNEAVDKARQMQFQDVYLKNNEEFQKLTDNERRQFILKNQAELQADIQTESTTREAAAKAAIKKQIADNNTYLENERKYGTAYATIHKAMHSEVYEGAKSAFSDLAELQQSSNATLKAIGKAASIANITMKTAESAMNVYAGFSTIPFIGPELGLAAAAAVIAYGAEQIGTVLTANRGGLVTGGIPGIDSVNALLTPGELVVPAQNYEEVVSAVSARRNGREEAHAQSASTAGYAHVEISFKEQFMEFLEAKLMERRQLNLSIQGV